MRTLLCLYAVLALPGAYAETGPKAGTPPSKEFQRVKTFVGDWKGEAEMTGKMETVTTSFRLTSGGSAIVETMGEGTEHEMVNVYHDVGGKLVMTHYCAMGNAPQMMLTSSDDKSMKLAAVKANGIDPKTSPHMHSLEYSMPDADHLEATWTSANMGKEHDKPMTFRYARVAKETTTP